MKKFDFKNINIIDNRQYIYPILMYIAGLICGAIIIINVDSSIFNKLFNVKNNDFIQLFINYFCVYFAQFTITVVLGLCLIGFPILYVVPLLTGIEIGIKLSFFYSTYSVKGIIYSLLMITPECAAFITILVLTIVKSNELSRGIYDLISKKSDMTEEIKLKSYLKSFVIYGSIIALISFINATCNYFLSSIINL